nr:EOG090X0EEC [Triops cancriformis]
MPDISNGSYGTRVIQASNIAPQATKDQMQTLFSHVGKVEDIRLYPMIRDVAVPVQVRICFVKFADPTSVGLAQHLGNTVFIDRAIMVVPYDAGELPDEAKAMEILNSGTTLPSMTEPKLPTHLICSVEGIPPNQTVATADSRLVAEGLPPYPPIPASLDSRKVEEIRRTVVAVNLDSNLSADQVIDFFSSAGEVKYFRFCSREGDGTKYALVEFSDQSSVYAALKLNNKTLADNVVRVQHATQAIVKPHGKTNEAAQREIEEAVKRVKEAQSIESAPVTPAEEIRSTTSRKRSSSRTKERKRSRSRDRKRSRSRERSRKSRSRSRDRRRGSKSRDRDKDRKKGRSRSRSRSRRGASKTRDKDRKDRDRRDRKDRDKSKDRTSDSKKEDKKKDDRSRKRSRSRSKGKSPSRSSRRSRSKSKGRRDEDRKEKDRKDKDRDKDRKRDRSHDRKKDDDRKRDKEKKSKDKKKESKVALDYDEKDESPRRKSDAEESEEDASRKYSSSKSSKGAKKAESESEEERKPSKRAESDSEDDRKSDVSKAASEKSRESSD